MRLQPRPFFITLTALTAYILTSFIPAINNDIILYYNLKIQFPVSLSAFGIFPYFISLGIIKLICFFYSLKKKGQPSGENLKMLNIKKTAIISAFVITLISSFILINYIDNLLNDFYLIYTNISLLLKLFFSFEILLGFSLTLFIGELICKKGLFKSGFLLLLFTDIILIFVKYLYPILF